MGVTGRNIEVNSIKKPYKGYPSSQIQNMISNLMPFEGIYLNVPKSLFIHASYLTVSPSCLYELEGVFMDDWTSFFSFST